MGELRARRRAKAVQHASQLLGLPIGLDRNTAEDDLLAIIFAGLRNEHLEGSDLIAAHRAHVTGVAMDSAIVSASAGDGRAVGVTIASHSSLAPTCNVRRWMVSIVGRSSTGKKLPSKARARR